MQSDPGKPQPGSGATPMLPSQLVQPTRSTTLPQQGNSQPDSGTAVHTDNVEPGDIAREDVNVVQQPPQGHSVPFKERVIGVAKGSLVAIPENPRNTPWQARPEGAWRANPSGQCVHKRSVRNVMAPTSLFMITTLRSRRVPHPSFLRSTSTSTATAKPNQTILDALEQAKAAEHDRSDSSSYRIRAFNKAIKEIGFLDRAMASPEDVKNLRGISSWVKKALVDLISSQNSLFISLSADGSIPPQSTLKRAEDDARRKALTSLQSVPGIGRKTSLTLFKMGIDTVEKLRASLSLSDDSLPSQMLTKSQLTYVKFYQHIVQPVTRNEAERVVAMAKELLPSTYEIVCTGAYRRGSETSPQTNRTGPPATPSDITKEYAQTEHRGRNSKAFSFNFTPTLALQRSRLLNEVLPSLQQGGLIGGQDLTELKRGEWKWTGVVRVPKSAAPGEIQESRKQRRDAVSNGTGTFRKADLNLVPFDSRASALLFLTGDNEFVRAMRLRASRMGLMLNEFGLWKWGSGAEHNPDLPTHISTVPRRGRGRPQKIPPPADGKWILIPTPTESVLLAELGLDYVPPERRNYAYLLSRFSKTGVKGWMGGEEQTPLTVLLSDK
ncbi:hypothetical protein D9757_007052 [Collybiopsis confluens]|uniref:DNA-directed DNA polymerase X domain-containing protein n=1 Tax=Collybiopsis confluens TaxID=2823264 RepID=A0A8H5HCE4_9AGAR|nr:hypothetical protein D9757_007052 [Collybiopsis confluens]